MANFAQKNSVYSCFQAAIDLNTFVAQDRLKAAKDVKIIQAKKTLGEEKLPTAKALEASTT